jgi:hypothetical protein
MVESERRRFAAVPSKFVRLYENTWAHGDEGAFLTSAELADATDAALQVPAGPAGAVYSLGVDLGLTHDLTAVVLVHVDARGRLTVDRADTWRGTPARPVDLTAVETTIRALARRFRVDVVHLDQWQGALLSQRLQAQGVTCHVHTIESAKLDWYATQLKMWFRERLIRVPADPTLIEQLESLTGEELSRRDRVRFTSGPGGHDDLVVALCLAAEPFVPSRTQDGQVRLLRSRLGRMQQAEIGTCHLGRGWWDCPMVSAPSAHAGCLRCPAYVSAVTARDAHAATTGPWLPLPAFIQQHMTPCRWLADARCDRMMADV